MKDMQKSTKLKTDTLLLLIEGFTTKERTHNQNYRKSEALALLPWKT
jgi:hypothetical protein